MAFHRSFRPLAGFWFLNDLNFRIPSFRDEFPSPCGVLVLKYVMIYDKPNAPKEFPSPCGVLVLKLTPEQMQ